MITFGVIDVGNILCEYPSIEVSVTKCPDPDVTFGIANSESCGKQIDGLIREGKITRLKRDNYKKKVANL